MGTRSTDRLIDQLFGNLCHLESFEAQVRNLLGQGRKPFQCFLHG